MECLQVLAIRCVLQELGISVHGDIADIGAAEETVRMLPLPPRQKQMVLDYMADIFIQFVRDLDHELDLYDGDCPYCYFWNDARIWFNYDHDYYHPNYFD